MSVDLQRVWQGYVAAWKAESTGEKRALLADSVAPACVYRDPLMQANGWEELIGYMLEFRKQVPGGYFETEEFMAHHGRSVAKWKMLNGQGIAIGEGVSFGEYDDSARLVAMTGFFRTPPSP
jgi:hypothetical protein